jgi:uncharacterized protein
MSVWLGFAGIAQQRGNTYIVSGTIDRAKTSLETPCFNICLLDSKTGICAGCGRTIEEIARWAAMSDAERRTLMAALPARQQRREEAKG